VHKPLRRREADAAVTTGHQCNLSVQFSHASLLGESTRPRMLAA
jgi:hypothetical protein